MQQDQKFYEKFFSKYPVGIHDSASRFLAVSSLLRGRVLDLACGTGTLSKYYTGEYVGIDWAGSAIKKAEEVRRPDARFMQLDVVTHTIVFPHLFDSAYLGEFLEHIENDEKVFENVLKNVKPDGLLVVTVPNADRVPDESHCRIFTVASIRRDYSKYGKVRFHSWSGERDRILFSIELGQHPEDEMTLVMICKDEAKGIEAAILSALPIVDRVVVSVDSKTTDKTKEIAMFYADEVKEHVWEDDFSKARNFAQEGVKSKWILFLDGHEYIESTGDALVKMKDDVDGIFVTVKMESGMTFLYPRIFRSHIKFKNKVHNVNECKTRRCAPDFVIVHDRMNLQSEDAVKRRNEQREKMLPAAMRAQIKENPKNARAWFHLANFHMMRHETDDAISEYKKVVKYGKSPDEVFLSLLHLGALQQQKDQWLRALWNFEKAARLMPDRWESDRVLGGYYYLHKNFKKALPHLVEALRPNKRRYAYQPMQQNFVETWDMIGQSFAQLDEFEAAKLAWIRAQKFSTDEAKKAYFEEKIKLVSQI